MTSHDAGLAVPDWPTSFGSIYKVPPMVGGVKFEHGHRMVAQAIGLLTIILAVWTWRVERRGWMRKLGWTALATVVLQGILGGTTVLNFLPPPVSAAHATLAQTFFCIVVLMAVFTGREWIENPRLALPDPGTPSLRTLSLWLVGALYLQLMLGAAFRHVWTKVGPPGSGREPAGEIILTYLVPHALNALLVAGLVIWTASRIGSQYRQVRPLARPALGLVFLLFIQLVLGFMAFLTRTWAVQPVQPMPAMVWSTVAHLATGALMLALAVVLAVEARRHLNPQQSQESMRPLERTAQA